MTETPRLSQSIAKMLLGRSPYVAWHYHRQLGGLSMTSDPMDTGNLIDERVFSGEKVVVLDFKDWRTNAAKEARAEAREKGLVPILTKQANKLQPLVSRIRDVMRSSGIDTEDQRWHVQDRLTWEQDGVMCEGTPDLWGAGILDGVLDVVDLKTSKRFEPDRLPNKAAAEWAIQAAAYPWALSILYPEWAGRIRWRWLLAETEAPYDVRWAAPTGDLLVLGEQKWARAVGIWKQLIASGWDDPWSSPDITIAAPGWALMQGMDDDEEEA